jgi:aryl-alcohol dehydrogenase-like predicted oxidoreductase
MRYRRFGRTNFQVSEIGHGLWGMGGWSGSSDQESLEALRTSVALGCNFFDSAWAYGDGRSDRLLGQPLREKRGQRLYAASKIPPKNGKWPATSQYRLQDAFPADHVLRHTELILEALGTDSIDLLQFHVWDDSWTAQEEWMKVVRRLKEQGLIRAFGLSLNRWEPANGIRALRTSLVDAVQVIYNIFDQAPEDELFPVCAELDIGVVARVPLDEGSLGGHLTRDTTFPPDDWRVGYFGPKNLAATVERVDALKRILPTSMTLPEMALRFILSHPQVHATIVGMRKLEHVRKNLGASDGGPLDPDLLATLRNHRWDRKLAPWSD